MAKKVLVFCGSSYQLLVAIRIIEKYYQEDEISLILSDTIANVHTIYEKAKRETFFSNVYLWKTKNVFLYSKKEKIRNAIMKWRYSEKVLEVYEGAAEKYDVFLYSNISDIVMHIANVLFRRNSTLRLEMFEDGFSTYSDYIGDFLDPGNIKTNLLYHVFTKTSVLYIFNTSLLAWKKIALDVRTIEPDYLGESLALINRLYSYEELDDDYNKKVIFFEESYAGDGKPIDDIDMMQHVAELIGKENIMIKTHPRNETNRYQSNGFLTNHNTNIPWEVVLLNENFSNTVFISIASNAVMNPYFLFGIKTPVVLLFKCTRYQESLYQQIIEFDNELCSKYPEVFFIPESERQFLEWIEEYLQRG